MIWGCTAPVSAFDDRDTALVRKLNNIRVSLLTCQPHDEIYSMYGHTAIRLQNKNNGEDIAINYGVFDSRANLFVLRFVFGLTDYSVGICNFDDFLEEYRGYGCGVYEQWLNLSPQEKLNFINALMDNLEPENVVYRYNFYYNNCTTRARDILLGAIDGSVEWGNSRKDGSDGADNVTFRQLLHEKTERYRWAAWGNDMLLGLGSDAIATHDERQFLPENLMIDFEGADVVYPDGTRKKLVEVTSMALQPRGGFSSKVFDSALKPVQVAWIFVCVIVAVLLMELFVLRKRLPKVHYAIHFFYALVGLVPMLMILSRHPTVRLNLQILILNPLFFYFALPKVYDKWGKYAVAGCVMAFLVGNAVQDYAEGMNVMALPLLLTFCVNYFENSKKYSTFAVLSDNKSQNKQQ